ncbi:hypothetical protein B5M42_001390 [Paenibacillus athensensis]|uniref:hypothetical protein n=1 Tax=Paenibacillus athensensis TaxID=1967502 RepID=UPI001430FE5E|nr:hypothetical protein [Paenibacillus athensensis]MCD1257491.1 hypothetical protein [Paenibacillus athensensis]
MYTVADLQQRQDLLNDIRQLERQLQQELGQPVALIAYANEPTAADEPADEGR